MYKAAVITGLSLSLIGCAAPTPQAPAPVAAAQPAAPAEGATAPAADESVIEVVDVPQVSAAADAPALRSQQERVCHREKRTGSNRVVRVCRTRAEIEKDALESKELFDELHRSQKEYNR